MSIFCACNSLIFILFKVAPTKSSMKIKMAKFVLGATYVFSKYFFSFGMTIACAIKNSLPFNTVWTLEYIVELLASRNAYFNIFLKGALLMLNYTVWKIIAVQGYLIVVDMLVGVLSQSFCQEMAYR